MIAPFITLFINLAWESAKKNVVGAGAWRVAGVGTLWQAQGFSCLALGEQQPDPEPLLPLSGEMGAC